MCRFLNRKHINFQLGVRTYISSTGGLIGRFCGNSLPPILTSTASRMAITFASDESISHEGFTANYVVLDAATGRKIFAIGLDLVFSSIHW